MARTDICATAEKSILDRSPRSGNPLAWKVTAVGYGSGGKVETHRLLDVISGDYLVALVRSYRRAHHRIRGRFTRHHAVLHWQNGPLRR